MKDSGSHPQTSVEVRAHKKLMAEDVDYVVAAMTDGMVGVELSNIIEVVVVNMTVMEGMRRDESTTMEELKHILSIKGLAVERGAASDLLGPLIGAFDILNNDDRFFFRVALPGGKEQSDGWDTENCST